MACTACGPSLPPSWRRSARRSRSCAAGGGSVVGELERRDGSLTSPDGTRLFWQAWEVPTPRATFAVVHGLGEHGGRYDRFARAMAERGFSTFAVDLRGMGRSDGSRGYVSSWGEWVKDAEVFVQMV